MFKKALLLLCGMMAFTPVVAQENAADLSWLFADKYEPDTTGYQAPLDFNDIASTKIEWGTCSTTNPFEFGTKLGEQYVLAPFDMVGLMALPNGDNLCFRAYTVLKNGIDSRPSGTVGKWYVGQPGIIFDADPTSIYEGQSSMLTWSTANTTTCAASGGWAGQKTLSGSQQVGPLYETTSFTLECSGPQGTIADTVIVTVTAPPPPPPTLTFAANPLTVAAGGQSQLTWSSTDATSCTASGAWSGAKATSGSELSPLVNAPSTFTLACTGQSGSVTKSVTVDVTYPTPTVDLTANPMTVLSGNSTMLNWAVEYASTCTASGGWDGNKSIGGFETSVPLTQTTTFTLTCTGQGGSASDSVTVDVTHPQPTLTLSAVPSTVMAGGISALSWSSENATSCTASGAWSGAKAASGSENTAPLNASALYELTCTGPGGSVTKSTTVTVTYPTPTLSFNVEPTTVVAGGSATLVWSATNANSCTASGGWSGTKAVSGSQSTGALDVTTSFILTCSGSGGDVSQTVTVDVTYLAPAVTITADPTTIVAGDTTTLTWSSTNATSCTASGAWSGTKAVNGTEESAPLTSSSTFTITCTGRGGDTASNSVTILVTPPPMPPVLRVAGVGPQSVYSYSYNRKARTYTLTGVVGSVPGGTSCNNVPIGSYNTSSYYQIPKTNITWSVAKKKRGGSNFAAACEWVDPATSVATSSASLSPLKVNKKVRKHLR